MILFGVIAASALALFATFGGVGEEEPDPAIAHYLVQRHKIRPEVARSIVNASKAIGCDPKDLAALISFETGGSFSPATKNSIDATGLIQFTKTTAERMGTTVGALALLSFDAQMAYVIRYFQERQAGAWSLQKLAMAVFWPPAMNWTEDQPFPPIVLKHNPTILTPRHYLAFVRRRL